VLLSGAEDQSPSERHIRCSSAWRMADKPFWILAERTGLHGFAWPSFRLWRRAVDAFCPDVVHIHWTYSSGTPPLISLPSLAADYPLVWTFHDMWAFTGGCTNSKGCERWMTGCGSCPILAAGEITGAMRPMPRDLTALQWRVKHWALSGTPMTIVAPSAWMANLVRQSPIVNRAEIVCVPNPLDTGFFRPRSKTAARQLLGLPPDRLVLFFIGKPHDVFFYEGRVPLFVEAVQLLRRAAPALADRLSILVVGGRGEELLGECGLPGVAVGAVSDELLLTACLSAADLMVNTTQFDNLPGVVQEAMSCGTPVVASDVGGLRDMLDGGASGLLADPRSSQAFATAIETALADPSLREALAHRARAKAVEHYDNGAVAPAMLSVYRSSCERAS